MTLSLASAQLVGTLLELSAYGVYIALIPQCFTLLRARGLKATLMKYMHLTFFINFLAITMNACTAFVRVVQAFTSHTDAELYFARTNSPSALLLGSSAMVVLITADALLVFRTFIVWNRDRRIIIIPVLLFVADCGSQWQNPLLNPTWQLVIFWAGSWLLNILCTSLIAYKIWKARRIANRLLSNVNERLNNAFVVIIESAAVYTLVSFATMIASILGHNSVYIVILLTPPSIGIVFLYAIISSSKVKESTAKQQSTVLTRSAVRRDENDRVSPDSPQAEHFNTALFSPTASANVDVTVQVHLKRTVHTDNWREADLEK
ncbi:unnamed protein product [Somion occarium]|uniref:Uncharacterized protein n=1 Tax=Somion occarium TaxID=3059160 RepID=A0ABP1E1Z3_9APHY